MTEEKPSGLTMADFSDCMDYGPYMGEVGYVGDNRELLEYPCNCFACRRDYLVATGAISEEDTELP
jgi:hypothetical protein